MYTLWSGLQLCSTVTWPQSLTLELSRNQSISHFAKCNSKVTCNVVTAILQGSQLIDQHVLQAGESLNNGEWALNMQADCDLVLRQGGVVSWSSNSACSQIEAALAAASLPLPSAFVWTSPCYLYLHIDGDLIVHTSTITTGHSPPTPGQESLWSSRSGPHLPGLFWLQLDNNGDLQIFNGYGIQIWDESQGGSLFFQ